jgi:hypothetical protein
LTKALKRSTGEHWNFSDSSMLVRLGPDAEVEAGAGLGELPVDGLGSE